MGAIVEGTQKLREERDIMSVKSRLKRIKKTPIGLLIWNEHRRFCAVQIKKRYNDFEQINKMYHESTGRKVNWSEPQRFTEKLQWLKLFYRNEQMPICSDKYTVRAYLQERGYADLLNEVYAVYDNPDDIKVDQLPDRFVLKGTAGSGWNLICQDKAKINWFWWKKIMKSWLKQDLSVYGREWNYEHLDGKIVIEKYLEDESGALRDYKVFCFNGVPKFMQVDESRFTNHKRIYVKCNGEVIKVQDGIRCMETFEITEIHRKLFEIAQNLSKDFPHVRVDFYICNEKIYFGEMTFFDGSGFYTLDPDSVDMEWGSYLTLPEPNANLDIYERLKTAD